MQTLVSAIDAAGYKKTLDNKNFKGTVWAPTNEAFAVAIAALNSTAPALLGNKLLLQTILNYHIIPDDVLYRKDLDTLQDWGTNLDDATVTIVKSGKAKIRVYYGDMDFVGTTLSYPGYAQVVVEDVKADKAVVQVINKVLIPPLPTL